MRARPSRRRGWSGARGAFKWSAGAHCAALTGRVLAGPGTEGERLQAAFRLCLARQPRPAESRRLTQYLAEQLEEFRSAPAEARAFLQGNPEEQGTDLAELAAWTAVARVLLNLDEFITRE